MYYPNETTVTNVSRFLSAVHARNRRHTSYVKAQTFGNCYLPTDLIVQKDQACQFVRNTQACKDMVEQINYLETLVCVLGVNSSILGTIILIVYSGIVLLTYVSFLILLAHFFIVPNLLTLAKRFNMLSGHQFGMALVVLPIVMPDLIFRFRTCTDLDSNGSVLLAEQIGKILACFCMGVIVIGFKAPFENTYRSPNTGSTYMLNTVVLLGGCIYVERIMHSEVTFDPTSHDNQQSQKLRMHAIISTLVFLCYLIYQISTAQRKHKESDYEYEDGIRTGPFEQSQGPGQKSNKKTSKAGIESSEEVAELPSQQSIDSTDKIIAVHYLDRKEESETRQSSVQPHVNTLSAVSLDSSDLEANDAASTTTVDSYASDEYPNDDGSPLDPNADMWTGVLNALGPRPHMRSLSFIFIVLLTPIWFLCAIMTPVIDEARPLNGWCKLVVCCSFLILPFILVVLHIDPLVFHGLVLLGIMGSTITYFLTHSRRIPKYNDFFAFLGLATSFSVYAIVDFELDSLMMQLLSYLDNWKPDTIVLITHPIPYCLMECVLILALIERGFVDMAFGIAIGLSIFVTYTTLPSIIFHPCYNQHIVTLLTADAQTAFIFLIVIVTTLALGVSLTNFELGWSHGFYALIMYCLLLFFVILSTGWVIHPYGTEHDLSLHAKKEDSNWA